MDSRVAMPARAPAPAAAPAESPAAGRSDAPAGLMVLGVLMGAGLALVAAGRSPSLLIVTAAGLVSAALARRLPAVIAVAAPVICLAGLLPVVMRLLPATGLPVSAVLVIPGVAGVSAWFSLWIRRRRLVLLAPRDLLPGAALVALSVAQVAWVFVVRQTSGQPKLAWVMRNDHAWNVVSTRFLLEDGGLDPASHRNPAPLANELVALFLSPGRGGVAVPDLLAHDVTRALQAQLVMVAAMSIVGGVLVGAAVRTSRVWPRLGLVMLAGLVPWTWAIAGQVFMFGFWNALLAGVLLLCVWSSWTAVPGHPCLSSGLQVVAALALLACWAPLAAVPAALAAATVVRHRRKHLALRGWRLAAWWVPVVVLIAYAGAVTVPDFRSESAGLAMDGGFPVFGQHLPVITVALVLGVLLLLASGNDRWERLGVVVVAAVGVAGAMYLMSHREGHPSGPWGYYPQKYTWTLGMLAPFVVLRACGGLLSGAKVAERQRRSVGVAAALLVTAVLLQVPPSDPRPATPVFYPIAHPTPDWRLSSLWPVLSMSYADRSSGLDPAAQTVLDLSDPRHKAVVARWSGDAGNDGFINFWLLQLQVDEAQENPRPFAYGVDSNDPRQLCALVDAWGGGVDIHTRSLALERHLQKNCPAAEFRVVLHD